MLCCWPLGQSRSLYRLPASACFGLLLATPRRVAAPSPSCNPQSFLISLGRERPPPCCVNADFEPTEVEGFADDGSGEGLVGDGVFIEMTKTGTNSRRIVSRIGINTTLDVIWGILTDYERLAEFIPGLAVSKLLEKRENFARLYQIGEQELAFGLKFGAKGIVDCFEKDLVSTPSRRNRDIEFNMIEGDFEVFQGKWSIEQSDGGGQGEYFQTILSYMVDVKPKLWLPVGLVEGRLCKEIQTNLLSIREEARKASRDHLPI
ncbi:hypothetical protein MLD38_019910 [Melastoma candidum]|uniref:Uncharacterized protein n=1 Tax=Melastoma candidum TaxID=119954 RepID=A0ACB9QBH4_9MYRT|nr:hypothetical protein MLD38_019910 [Melastoma candidum]